MTFSREGLGSATGMDKPGVAFVDGVQTPHSVTILGNTILPNAKGKRVVPAHLVVVRYGNVFGFLKRSRLTLPSMTNSPNLTLAQPVCVFATGDLLRLVEPYATVSFALLWAANDTVLITINGAPLVIVAGDTVLANIAANVATAINNSPLSQFVQAVASGADVYIFANDSITPYPLSAVETTASTGTATASGSSLTVSTAPIGTIQAINVESGVITLSGNASLALPVGTNIGVPIDDMLGVYPHSLDLTNRDRLAIAPVSGCDGYYQQSMPHFDEDIRRRLNNIIFATKF